VKAKSHDLCELYCISISGIYIVVGQSVKKDLRNKCNMSSSYDAATRTGAKEILTNGKTKAWRATLAVQFELLIYSFGDFL
jgi:hypothetical protein